MRKYVMAAGGIHDKTQNWAVCYEKGDPMGPVPIFTLVSAAITPSIQAFFNAWIEKQRETYFLRDLIKTSLAWCSSSVLDCLILLNKILSLFDFIPFIVQERNQE